MTLIALSAVIAVLADVVITIWAVRKIYRRLERATARLEEVAQRATTEAAESLKPTIGAVVSENLTALTASLMPVLVKVVLSQVKDHFQDKELESDGKSDHNVRSITGTGGS